MRVPLPRAHKLAHLQWATEHHKLTLNEWGTLLFSDKSQFFANFIDRRRRVWCRPGERNLPQKVVLHDSFSRSSVMIWRGISIGGRTKLIIIENGSLTGQRYSDEILRPVVRLYAGAMRAEVLLMADHACPHQASL